MKIAKNPKYKVRSLMKNIITEEMRFRQKFVNMLKKMV